MLSQKSRSVPFLMWLFPLIFFAYQFILRLWPGLMMQPIMAQFSIDARHFGMLAAFYYYGYSGMQIPVAILLDRYQPRYIIFAFATICGLSMLMFSYTNHFYVALLSRFLIGAGSAVGFLGVSKVVSEWFPQLQYARMIGFSFSVGLMGAIYGGKPINLLIETYSWQSVALSLAFISILIGLGALFVLRSPKRSGSAVKEEQFKMANFKGLLSSPMIWLLAFANLLMVGSLEGFADVWGVPYLMMSHGLNKGDAAGIVSCIFFGMIFGGPLLAYFSKKFGNYPVIACAGIGMALAFSLLLSSVNLEPWMLSTLFFSVGLLCCYQVIVFAAGAELVAPQNLGVTIAFLNCINMLGGSFFHTLIGTVMDLCWSGAVGPDGLRHYDLEAYQYALSVVPGCAFVGAVIIMMVSIKVMRMQYQRQIKRSITQGA